MAYFVKCYENILTNKDNQNMAHSKNIYIFNTIKITNSHNRNHKLALMIIIKNLMKIFNQQTFF
jgi:hypothetical protein